MTPTKSERRRAGTPPPWIIGVVGFVVAFLIIILARCGSGQASSSPATALSGTIAQPIPADPMPDLTPVPAAAASQVTTTLTGPNSIVIVLPDTVLFPFGEAHLTDQAQSVLDQIATRIIEGQRPDRVVIAGHTDGIGSRDANIALSEARADSVRSGLVARGVAPSLIESWATARMSPLLPKSP